jgi:hypothetical protein
MSKKIIYAVLIVLALALIGYVVYARAVVKKDTPNFEVGATTIELCNAETTYTESGDKDYTRININFQDSDEAITLTAKTGYQIVKVELDVENDGHTGYFDYTSQVTDGVKFNPNPGDDIDHVKVTVKKVCREVCNDRLALNFEEVVVGQTVANNDLCEYTEAGQCPAACGLEASEVADGKGGMTVCEATEACPIPVVQENKPVLENNTTDAPQCTATAPVLAALNFHVLRNGDTAIAKWMPTNGDSANIYYKLVTSASWEHAVRDIPNNGYFIINGLGNRDWTFALQQSNSCAGGLMSQFVVDGGTSHWVLFR